MNKVLMAEVNISEGTNNELIEKVKKSFIDEKNIEIVDIDSNVDHNRTVFTYKGEPSAVLNATKKLAKCAVELIDMRNHKGSHPRMGAVDVVPFIPVKNVTTEEAVEIAKEFGKFLGEQGVPVYFYEDAQEKEYRKTLPSIRKGQYEALEEKMKDPKWAPYEKTPIHRVFETIKSEANRYNVNIVDTELVGPVPIYALRDILDFYLKISESFSLDQIYF